MIARLQLTRRLANPPLRLVPQRQFSHSTRLQQNVRYTRFGGSGSQGGGWRPQFDRWDRNTKIFAGVCGAGVSYYVYHLERVEETGRWRFIDVSLETERQVAEQSQKEVLAEFGNRILPPSHPITKYIAEIASRIITAGNLGTVKNASNESHNPWLSDSDDKWSDPSAVDRLRQEWEVFVIQDPKTPNAFVTPGGKIFVFTGILPACGNDDGLATVLGHEIAHQVVRHSAEKMSGMKVLTALVFLLEVLGLDVGISRIGLTLLMSLPNSRKMEAEADQIGLRLMAKACYNPRESTKLWERMSKLAETPNDGSWLGGLGSKLSEVDFHQTHPANSKRIKASSQLNLTCLAFNSKSPDNRLGQNLESWIPEALSIRAGSSCSMGENASLGDTFGDFKVRVTDAIGSVGAGSTFPRW